MSKRRIVIQDGCLYYRDAEVLAEISEDLLEEFENVADDHFNIAAMSPPQRPELPFFAYGLFKPDQLGFNSLRPFIKGITHDTMDGDLYERDGVPLFVENSPAPTGEVIGTLITFKEEHTEGAYRTIASIEPEQQYKWVVLTTGNGTEANVLVAKSTNGAHPIDGYNWDGKKDPHFNEALNLVESIAKNSQFNLGSVERLMELQMAYMLLWTAIERYTSLRYHLRKKVMAKIRHMAAEQGFIDGLKLYVMKDRKVYSTDAGRAVTLSQNDPKHSLDYYYQVRSNVTHRGKALMTDAALLDLCIKELLEIFRYTIVRAFEECREAAPPSITAPRTIA